MKTALKLLEVLFYPCDNLTQTIFHLLFSFCYRRKGGEPRQRTEMGEIFLFHSFSQRFGGNKKEWTHSQAELRAVCFMKTQFAANISSARPDPFFVEQILS